MFHVACTQEPLPSSNDLLGAGSPVNAAPAQRDAQGKLAPVDWEAPLAPGVRYLLTTERRSVFGLEVRPTEPVPDGLDHDTALGLTADQVAVLRASKQTVWLALAYQSDRPSEDVFWGTLLADRIAELGAGCVHDGFAARYFGPGGWRVGERATRIDCREHVRLHLVTDEVSGKVWVHTHGLIKFGHPEFETFDLTEDQAASSGTFFLMLMQYVIDGVVIRPGQTLGRPDVPIYAKAGSKELEHWDGVPALELLDVTDGKPVRTGAARGIQAQLGGG